MNQLNNKMIEHAKRLDEQQKQNEDHEARPRKSRRFSSVTTNIWRRRMETRRNKRQHRFRSMLPQWSRYRRRHLSRCPSRRRQQQRCRFSRQHWCRRRPRSRARRQVVPALVSRPAGQSWMCRRATYCVKKLLLACVATLTATAARSVRLGHTRPLRTSRLTSDQFYRYLLFVRIHSAYSFSGTELQSLVHKYL